MSLKTGLLLSVDAFPLTVISLSSQFVETDSPAPLVYKASAETDTKDVIADIATAAAAIAAILLFMSNTPFA
ncbi:MAG: hypothetical protein IJ251_08170 [Oscillospiraceae bacterium]|nr:hypothetical protein [Oscillospiraceae bacterium]